MRMSPEIILSGQNPNFLQTMGQAAQVAGATNAVQDQNALRGLYREQGPGIMAGEQGAMNALAQLDPMQAAQFQQNREQSQMARERLSMARQAAARAAETHVAQMDAVTRQKEAEDLDRTLSRLAMANDPQSWDAFAQEVMPEAVGQFEQRDMILAQGLGLKDVLAMQQPAKPADEYQRYVQEEQAAGRQPLSRIDFEQAKKGSEIIYGPDGNIIVQRGPGNAPPKLTVDAAKNTGFLIRTQEANKTLNDLEGQGTEFWQQNAENVPLGLGNYARTPEFQRFDQARRDFVNAILRRESGAVISEEEFDNANKQYFPMPGDGPEVIAQKRRNRETAIEGLRVGSGDGAAYVDRQSQAAQQQEQVPDFSAMSQSDLAGVDIDTLSDEALTAYIKATEAALSAGINAAGGN